MKTLTVLKDINNASYLGIKLTPKDTLLLQHFLDIANVEIDNFDALNQKLLKRNNGDYHVTVFNVMDYNINFQDNIGLHYLQGLQIHDLKMLGIGSINKNDMYTYYIVCQSDTIDKIRLTLGYSVKDLHITIGYTDKDLFHARKNVCNIFTFDI